MFLAILLLSVLPSYASNGLDVSGPRRNCVLYETVKGMFLIGNALVSGKNCEIQVKLERTAENQSARILAVIPPEKFDSGNGMRDQHIAKILGGKEHEPLRFTSNWLSPNQISKIEQGERTTVHGTLEIKGKLNAVTLTVKQYGDGSSRLIRTETHTTLQALGVEVPSIGPFGFIAKPGEEIRLISEIYAGGLK